MRPLEGKERLQKASKHVTSRSDVAPKELSDTKPARAAATEHAVERAL